MSKYKAGVIGCGNIAGKWNEDPTIDFVLTHAKAYEMHPDTELMCCFDIDEGAAAAFQKRWNLRRHYTSISDMLKREQLDLISICVPTSAHRAVVESICTEHRTARALLLEKPLADTLEDSERISSLVREANLLCNVNYLRRYDKVFQEIRQTIHAKKLGTVQQFRALYTKGLLHNGSHLINLLRYFFGEVASYSVVDHFPELAKDPTVSLYLHFAGGAKGIVQGLRESSFSVFELDVMLESGIIRIFDFGRKIDYVMTVTDPVFPGYNVLSSDPVHRVTDLNNALLNYVDNTVRAMAGQEPLLCPVADALADIKLISAIKKECL